MPRTCFQRARTHVAAHAAARAMATYTMPGGFEACRKMAAIATAAMADSVWMNMGRLDHG
jgi:hypothetical protein